MTSTSPFVAFSAEDATQAFREWGANCGPASLAATTGKTLADIRPHLGWFEQCGYMNSVLMRKAIVAAGFDYMWVFPGVFPEVFPRHGLVLVQFGGPWLPEPGKYGKWASRFTHWVASKLFEGEPWVFDVNGGWMTRADWERDIIPRLIEATKRCDGTWHARYRWEIRRRKEMS